MPRMRSNKAILKTYLSSEQWQEHLQDILEMDEHECVGPLLSFVLLGGEMTFRSARALGMVVAKLTEQDLEAGRNVVRRLMWQMNEESGNIGWGIPECFAEVLVYSPKLAKDFYGILLSYIIDTGRDDNFCDHDILRRSCFWGVGRLASVRPELCVKIVPWLAKGLSDTDVICRGLAAWAVAKMPMSLDFVPALNNLARSDAEVLNTLCTVFEDNKLQEISVGDLVHKALAR